jgi:hypothetical protein
MIIFGNKGILIHAFKCLQSVVLYEVQTQFWANLLFMIHGRWFYIRLRLRQDPRLSFEAIHYFMIHGQKKNDSTVLQTRRAMTRKRALIYLRIWKHMHITVSVPLQGGHILGIPSLWTLSSLEWALIYLRIWKHMHTFVSVPLRGGLILGISRTCALFSWVGCYVVAFIACTRSTFGNGCILSSFFSFILTSNSRPLFVHSRI